MRNGLAALALTIPLFLAACTPSIGDKCVLSTDCSLQGNRLCDTSQPGGYCTVLNCTRDTCPDTAACVLFHGSVPGCPYNDRTLSRTGRTFCVAQCHSNSDCRDGYVCADPRQPPWNALILDDDQLQLVCIVPPDNGVIGPNASVPIDFDAAVCQASGPPVPPLEGGPPEEGGTDASSDAGDGGAPDAKADAADGGDAGSGSTDAGDAAG